uniref:NADH-ubiquinone oxidoreductase chain 4L n=1 Tax=Homidia sp. TaxID=3054010 RepID=A0AAU6PTJ3_9HEXA
MEVIFVVSILMFSGIWVYCSTREHLLSALLSLEFMVLGIFFFLFVSLASGLYFYSLLYLVITACEGALGLSLLVVMGRTHSSDFLKIFSLK